LALTLVEKQTAGRKEKCNLKLTGRKGHLGKLLAFIIVGDETFLILKI
jgi:hypothetical protein